jgi:hypothetical protein
MQLGYKVSHLSHNRLYEKKNGFEVIFLQEYFENINVIITTSP